MGRRSDHTREELRELALQAGAKIVEEEGLRALTLRRIARDIGYTAGSLYSVFKDLDDIIIEINCLTLDQLYERVSKVPKARSPKKILERLANEYLSFTADHSNCWSALIEHRLPSDYQYPEHYEMRVHRLIDIIKEPIAPYFSSRKKSEPERSARVLWASVYGICALDSQNKLPEFETARSLIHTLIENYLKGISGQR